MKRSLGITALVAFAVAIGCSGSTPSDPAPTGRPVVLGERTQVVDKAAADKITVETDRLVFPKQGFENLLSKTAGDILVGDKGSPTSKNKDGYLRKVKTVAQEGETIVVTTDQATIPEAIKDGTFTGTLQIPTLGPTGPQYFHDTPGLQPQGGPKNLLKFDGIVLFDETPTIDVGGKQIGFHTWAKTSKGSVDFTPKFDVGADVGFFELKEFHAIATGTLDAVVEFDLGLQAAGNLDGDTLALLIAQAITKKPSKVLFEYPIDLGTLMLGPLPLPSSADFKVTLDCEFIWKGGAEVKVGAEGQAVITAGIKYKNGEISGVFDKSATINPTGPNWILDGAVKVRCDLKPQFDLKFFGIASAGVWGDAYGQLNANVECGTGDKLTGKVNGEAFAGARAGAYAKVDVFGLYKWHKECTLFDVESTHATASGTFTLPGGQGGTCTPDVAAVTPPPKADPNLCFGNDGSGGSGGTGVGGSGGGGSGGSAGKDAGGDADDGGEAGPCTKVLVAPDVWTCDPKKYGDCICDCNCGADDDDCKTGECNGCTHDECTTGDALNPSCNTCVAEICKNDSYCCATLWSGSCVMEVETYCGKKCP
ncbi:MAG: hypothetical protein HY898_33980 [Deltaproteobacteria bacterium]|nr:hypothetical protein [Deltaproteobacteria bacterium]